MIIFYKKIFFITNFKINIFQINIFYKNDNKEENIIEIEMALHFNKIEIESGNRDIHFTTIENLWLFRIKKIEIKVFFDVSLF